MDFLKMQGFIARKFSVYPPLDSSSNLKYSMPRIEGILCGSEAH